MERTEAKTNHADALSLKKSHSNMSIQKYIDRKYIRTNTASLLENGKWYRFWGGKWIKDSEFDRLFPIMTRIGGNNKNPDSRKFYLET